MEVVYTVVVVVVEVVYIGVVVVVVVVVVVIVEVVVAAVVVVVVELVYTVVVVVVVEVVYIGVVVVVVIVVVVVVVIVAVVVVVVEVVYIGVVVVVVVVVVIVAVVVAAVGGRGGGAGRKRAVEIAKLFTQRFLHNRYQLQGEERQVAPSGAVVQEDVSLKLAIVPLFSSVDSGIGRQQLFHLGRRLARWYKRIALKRARNMIDLMTELFI